MSTAAEAVAFKPTGRSIIACKEVEATQSPLIPQDLKFYAVEPHSGKELPTLFLSATHKEVDEAGWKAWQAFHTMQDRSAADRAALLELIATKIAEMGDDLLALATDETGLGPARLVSERDRTVNTLRMFATVVREGSWVDAAIETGQPSRRPVAKPDLRRMLRPMGPVAVFGAGNFPLAYSTAGGDTASALAAGCPVIVKGHPGHPGTGELVAQAVASAVEEARFDPGTFSFLHAGGPREMVIGESLVRHAAVRAVGFTGSLGGGMALAKMAAERPDPIPVFAEMGSTNPVFVLPSALESQAEAIAERVFSSATNANGQMCTCPGLLFIARGNGMDAFLASITKLADAAAPQLMLSQRTRGNFERRVSEVADVAGVELRAGRPPEPAADKDPHPIKGSPLVFRTNFETFRKTPTLHEEGVRAGPDRGRVRISGAACRRRGEHSGHIDGNDLGRRRR
jgi:NADP-dependent aldehyde dehydrogenase